MALSRVHAYIKAADPESVAVKQILGKTNLMLQGITWLHVAITITLLTLTLT